MPNHGACRWPAEKNRGARTEPKASAKDTYLKWEKDYGDPSVLAEGLHPSQTEDIPVGCQGRLVSRHQRHAVVAGQGVPRRPLMHAHCMVIDAC